MMLRAAAAACCCVPAPATAGAPPASAARSATPPTETTASPPSPRHVVFDSHHDFDSPDGWPRTRRDVPGSSPQVSPAGFDRR